MVQPATTEQEDSGGRYCVLRDPSKDGLREQLRAALRPGGTRVKQVLLVDKDKLFRQILALVLRWHTDLKENIAAGSLAEVRRILANSNHKPDLAIIDADLVNGEGFSLIRELRASNLDVPVLAITLGRDAERRERALRAGAGEVLTMAASPKEIAEVAMRLVGE
jgi:DNA-binding NarL/FixJ family response regulator